MRATHPPPVVDAWPDLPDEGRRADEEEDDGDEAGEVEDGRHFLLQFRVALLCVALLCFLLSGATPPDGHSLGPVVTLRLWKLEGRRAW